jgi:hypothetical protein
MEIGRDKWDEFADLSDEAWLWHRFDLQDALATWRDYQDKSFSLSDSDSNGELVAIMPLHCLAGLQLSSLGGVACSNWLSLRQKRKVLSYMEEILKKIADEQKILDISISIPPMAPAFCGERCPRVNPLLEMGCENRLTQTWVVDLRKGKEALWKGLEGRARTAVKKALKNNVTVREAEKNNKGLDEYYRLHCETYNRTGVPPHPKAYFTHIWNNFYNKSYSQIFFAEHNGIIVAAENFGIYKNNVIYWTGAASERGLELEANSLIQWNAIQWMVGRGCKWYETGEAFPHIREGKLKGLNDFKKSFGGELFPSYKGNLNLPIEQPSVQLHKKRMLDRILDVSLRDVLNIIRKYFWK